MSSPASPAVDAAASESVLRPDHGAHRKHFIFTEEHDQLRESIANFVTKELAPTPSGGRTRPSTTGSSRAWASSASSGSPTPRSTAARAATTLA